jgi:hypothetical protein
MTKNNLLFFVFEGTLRWSTIQATLASWFAMFVSTASRKAMLTLLWVLEGSVGLHDGDLRQQLDTDDLAIVNRHPRWSLRRRRQRGDDADPACQLADAP